MDQLKRRIKRLKKAFNRKIGEDFIIDYSIPGIDPEPCQLYISSSGRYYPIENKIGAAEGIKKGSLC